MGYHWMVKFRLPNSVVFENYTMLLLRHTRLWSMMNALCQINRNVRKKKKKKKKKKKPENNDIQIEYREGNATIKVLDKANNDKPKIILTVDLIQCKTIITFKDTQQAKRCRFCQQKLTDKNRV